MSIEKMMEEAARNTDLIKGEVTNPPEILELVYNTTRDYCESKPELKPGMFVRWKRGLKNKIWPDYEQLGVVVEVLDEPIFDPNITGGSPYFMEPNDVRLAVIDDSTVGEDNDLSKAEVEFYWFNSKRFEIVEVEGLKPFDEEE